MPKMHKSLLLTPPVALIPFIFLLRPQLAVHKMSFYLLAKYLTKEILSFRPTFVENNTGSYFNFQAETTVGDTWAMDCYMNNDGTIVFSTGGGATNFFLTPTPQTIGLI